jgi:hypothetical protein
VSLPTYRAAVVLLVAVATFVVVGVALDAVLVLAADADATLMPVITAGDPRSDGGGPGIVGSPLAILMGVIALGVVTVLVTVLLVRLTQRR